MVRVCADEIMVQTVLVKMFGRDLFTWTTPWAVSARYGTSRSDLINNSGKDDWHASMGLLKWKAVV
jgi:hypothetical protein